MQSSMPRLNWVEIQGFRAFGKVLQRIDLSSSIAVIWGPNSQGKTSFAEAVEFLLTGTIVRRELLASAQDEFADSLRNAHLPAGTPVFVQAEIVDTGGKPHLVRRTMGSDFSKKTSCSTVLEIDGRPAAQSDLASIGVVLSQPPMAVPILMQHTLGYLFTAKPQERSLYFKALLEVSDLDRVRTDICLREAFLEKADTPLVTKLRSCTAITAVATVLRPLLDVKLTVPAVGAALAKAAQQMLSAAGLPAATEPPARLEAIRNLLTEKRSKTFPVARLDREPLPAGKGAEAELLVTLTTFLEQSAKIEAETKTLTHLFSEVLKVPSVSAISGEIDCPVCGTEDALTPARVQKIRDELKASGDYIAAEESARNSLQTLGTSLQALDRALGKAQPKFLLLPRHERLESGITTEGMRVLLPASQTDLVGTWISQLKVLQRARRRVVASTARAKLLADRNIATYVSQQDIDDLRVALDAVSVSRAEFAQHEKNYAAAEQPLRDGLLSIVDAKSDTVGWQDFLDIADDEDGLLSDLVDLRARETVKKEFAKALKDIDKAKEDVLNAKFVSLSKEIQDWWELLRPEETVYFSGVKPRPASVRTIDFKASLAVSADRLNPHIRDVIAIFSVSQMHCLGLAAFLARTMREKSGFIVLDDPILSSDDDHRVHFLNGALETLMNAGHQVIVLTQDQNIQKNLGTLYAHKDIDCFEILMREPGKGTEVDKTSDSLSAMLARAKPFLGNIDGAIRKQACERLRDAAERLCKEIIVKNEHLQGNKSACVTDYTGPKGTLEYLIPKAEPYLTNTADPGKLRTIASNLNPGNHDDVVPNKETLKHVFGDLVKFQKDYRV